MKIAAVIYKSQEKLSVFDGVWDANDEDQVKEAELLAKGIGGNVVIIDASLSETVLEDLIHPACVRQHSQEARIPAQPLECLLVRPS